MRPVARWLGLALLVLLSSSTCTATEPPSLTPLQAEFISDEGNDAYNQTTWYGYNSSLFAFLFYFPGDKIYGWEAGQRLLCSNATGNYWLQADGQSWTGADVPGVLSDPTGRNRFRRMVIGAYDWVFNSSNTVCPTWTIPLLVTIGENNDWVVNSWVNITSHNGNITIQDDGNTTLQYEITVGLVHPRSPVPITRVVFSDGVEDSCYAALKGKCGSYLGNNHTASCGLCAAAHAVNLARAGCLKHSEHNTKDVVEFWCSCDGDADTCGGPPPGSAGRMQS